MNGKLDYPTEKEFVYIKMEHISKEILKMENSMIKMLLSYCQMEQDIEEMFKDHSFRAMENLKKGITKAKQNTYIQGNGEMVNLMVKGKKSMEMEVSMKVLL